MPEMRAIDYRFQSLGDARNVHKSGTWLVMWFIQGWTKVSLHVTHSCRSLIGYNNYCNATHDCEKRDSVFRSVTWVYTRRKLITKGARKNLFWPFRFQELSYPPFPKKNRKGNFPIFHIKGKGKMYFMLNLYTRKYHQPWRNCTKMTHGIMTTQID